MEAALSVFERLREAERLNNVLRQMVDLLNNRNFNVTESQPSTCPESKAGRGLFLCREEIESRGSNAMQVFDSKGEQMNDMSSM